MIRQLMLLVALVLLGCACSSSDPAAPARPDFLGAWQPLPRAADTDLDTYKRIPALEGDHPGIEFRADGTAARRTHGWCGTPPLTYFNVEGIWQELSAGVIRTEIDLDYSTSGIRWEIITIEDDVMTCRLTYEEGE